jgi:hypothetical protein
VLAPLLEDPRGKVRCSALGAVIGLGPAAATLDILHGVGLALRGRADAEDQARALLQLEEGGTVTPERLLQTAKETRKRLEDAPANDLREPILLEALASRWGDDGTARERALLAVQQLGTAAASAAVLAGLERLLPETNLGVQEALLRAVAALGPAAGTANVHSRLALALGHLNEAVCAAAHDAAVALGPAGLRGVLADLAALLRDPEQKVRQRVPRATRLLGAQAATPEFLDAIAGTLDDPDPRLRTLGAEAVEGIGPAAATPRILARLFDLADDADASVRYAVEQALEALRPTVGRNHCRTQQ